MKHHPPFNRFWVAGFARRPARMVSLLVAACAPLLYSDVSAQLYSFDGRNTASVEADGLHLQIRFEWPGDTFWYTTPAAIDVYRMEIDFQCGSWERVTDQPVPFSWQDDDPLAPHLAFEVVDVTAQPGLGYAYMARPVDVNRTQIDGDAYIGIATHGIALLGHGTLTGEPGGCGESYVQYIGLCPDECFPGLRFSASPEVAPYINSGTTVLVYGVIESVMWTCQTSEEIALLYSAVPGGCIVAVESTTWGYVKSLYR